MNVLGPALKRPTGPIADAVADALDRRTRLGSDGAAAAAREKEAAAAAAAAPGAGLWLMRKVALTAKGAAAAALRAATPPSPSTAAAPSPGLFKKWLNHFGAPLVVIPGVVGAVGLYRISPPYQELLTLSLGAISSFALRAFSHLGKVSDWSPIRPFSERIVQGIYPLSIPIGLATLLGISCGALGAQHNRFWLSVFAGPNLLPILSYLNKQTGGEEIPKEYCIALSAFFAWYQVSSLFDACVKKVIPTHFQNHRVFSPFTLSLIPLTLSFLFYVEDTNTDSRYREVAKVALGAYLVSYVAHKVGSKVIQQLHRIPVTIVEDIVSSGVNFGLSHVYSPLKHGAVFLYEAGSNVASIPADFVAKYFGSRVGALIKYSSLALLAPPIASLSLQWIDPALARQVNDFLHNTISYSVLQLFPKTLIYTVNSFFSSTLPSITKGAIDGWQELDGSSRAILAGWLSLYGSILLYSLNKKEVPDGIEFSSASFLPRQGRALRKRSIHLMHNALYACAPFMSASLAKKLNLYLFPKQPNPVFNKQLQQQINDVITSIKMTKKNDGSLSNLLLSGPPGTGKTMVGKRIAEEAGCHFIKTTGDQLTRLIGSSLQEVHRDGKGAVQKVTFDAKPHIKKLREILYFGRERPHWAFYIPNKIASYWIKPIPTILFIDEIDVFLKQRSALGYNQHDVALRELINLFLAETGSSSKELAIIGTTNHQEHMDWAAIDRFHVNLHVGYPDEQARREILKEHIEPLFPSALAQERSSCLNDDGIARIAKKTEGLSGRRLSFLVDRLYVRKAQTESNCLTVEIIDEVVDIVTSNFRARDKKAPTTFFEHFSSFVNSALFRAKKASSLFQSPLRRV